MAIEALLGGTSPRTFIEEYFLRLPFAMPDGAGQFAALGSWETIDRLAADPQADLLVVRQGCRSEVARPRSAADVRSLLSGGHTVLFRHAERHDAAFDRLAAEFAADFDAPVDIHLYATPPETFGFGWHYDVEDVFIIQTAGVKEYSLRKNTVNPWPLLETVPTDMRYERELMPLLRCDLEAGDWLYIPNGYWHRAQARTESLSLAIGVLPPTGIDVIDAARRELLSSLLWRQRLPVSGRAAQLPEQAIEERYREQLVQLAEDVARLLTSEGFARRMIESRRRAEAAKVEG